jgi:hypothetical protein
MRIVDSQIAVLLICCFTVCLGSLLSGCVYFPALNDIDHKQINRIEAGVTSRDQVSDMLFSVQI